MGGAQRGPLSKGRAISSFLFSVRSEPHRQRKGFSFSHAVGHSRDGYCFLSCFLDPWCTASLVEAFGIDIELIEVTRVLGFTVEDFGSMLIEASVQIGQNVVLIPRAP